ncbi:hypothetical protein BLOT_010758 [Blomia tropicalis]|nr:hypothetical protein BLOT_010758 [Blomia tropicalis]
MPQPDHHHHQKYPNDDHDEDIRRTYSPTNSYKSTIDDNSPPTTVDDVSSSSSSSSTAAAAAELANKEFNKRLLVSLGMLLPALAAIIGVVAWAISAEVVMGAKREAARRHSTESSFRYVNKYDYSKFQQAPTIHSLPNKEMLVDPKLTLLQHHPLFANIADSQVQHQASPHSKSFENLDFINQPQSIDMGMGNQHETTMIMRKMGNQLNDKLRDKLTHENLAQLIEKLLANHNQLKNVKQTNGKPPQIVVVAPQLMKKNQTIKVTPSSDSSMIETRIVSTTKPKAFNLKMATTSATSTSNTNSKKDVGGGGGSKQQQQQQQQQSNKTGAAGQTRKTKSTQIASNKRRTTGNTATSSSSSISSSRKSSKITNNNNKNNVETSHSKGQSTSKNTGVNKSNNGNSNNKNFKAKIYEKEIDLLMQKIEKLEKQQNIGKTKSGVGGRNDDSTNVAIPEKVANSELIKGRPLDIAERIKGFLNGGPPMDDAAVDDENVMMRHNGERDSQLGANEPWQPTGGNSIPPPPPLPPLMPPMPPMPYMPYMPPIPYHQDSMGHHQLPPPPQSPSSYQPGSYSQQSPPQTQMDQYPSQMEPSYPTYQQAQHQQSQPEPMQNNYDHQPQSQPQPQSQSQQSYQQDMPPATNYDQLQSETTESESKPKKGIFGGKFKLSNIFNSVIPKSKKSKQQQQQQQQDRTKMATDSRKINIGNSMNEMIEPMMVQESQMYPHMNRGHMPQYHHHHYGGGGGGEPAGFSINMGAGPIGGGGQIKASPMGILKSLVLPLTGIPKWVNGKVVLGIVLENGIGKKPKTVFQHFSTGKI